MSILIRRPEKIPTSEITPESAYRSRRAFMGTAGALTAGLLGGLSVQAYAASEWLRSKIPRGFGDPDFEEPITPFELASSYNNYYEFGTDKSDPSKYADQLTIDPWSVEVSGEVAKPGTYTLEDMLAPHDFEERVYRLRCVEAWSMVIPWIGFPLGDLLSRFEPTSKAKYVEFTTLHRPREMRGNV